MDTKDRKAFEKAYMSGVAVVTEAKLVECMDHICNGKNAEDMDDCGSVVDALSIWQHAMAFNKWQSGIEPDEPDKPDKPDAGFPMTMRNVMIISEEDFRASLIEYMVLHGGTAEITELVKKGQSVNYRLMNIMKAGIENLSLHELQTIGEDWADNQMDIFPEIEGVIIDIGGRLITLKIKGV